VLSRIVVQTEGCLLVEQILSLELLQVFNQIFTAKGVSLRVKGIEVLGGNIILNVFEFLVVVDVLEDD